MSLYEQKLKAESHLRDIKRAIKAERKKGVIKDNSIYKAATALLNISPLDHSNIYQAHRLGSWLHQTATMSPTLGLKCSSLLQYKDGKEYIGDNYSFHGTFTLLQAMDVYRQYTSTEPAFGHFKTFLLIMAYSGEFNFPVDVYGMNNVLGIQQSTLSRIIGILGEETDGEDAGTSGRPVIRHGLIQCTKPDKNTDGRRKYVNLTPKGGALAQEISEVLKMKIAKKVERLEA